MRKITLVSLIIFGAASALAGQISVNECDFFGPYFKNVGPTEGLIFIFSKAIRGKTAYQFSSGHDTKVESYVPYDEIFRQEFGRELSDCIFIIHNHPAGGRWSLDDREFCAWLRARGFRGLFLLYIKPTGDILLADF